MSGLTLLDVIVAMAFVYFILSVISSGIQELLAGFLKLRARDLDAGIRNLLCDDDFADTVLAHPLLKALGSTRAETAPIKDVGGRFAADVRDGRRNLRQWLTSPLSPHRDFAGKPSYVPADAFSHALTDTLSPAYTGQLSLDRIEQQARALADHGGPATERLKAAIISLMGPAGDVNADIHAAQTVDDLRQVLSGSGQSKTNSGHNVALSTLQRLENDRQSIARALLSLVALSRLQSRTVGSPADVLALANTLPDQSSNEVLTAIGGASTLDEVRQRLTALAPSVARDQILAAIVDNKTEIERWRAHVETWFNQAMDRVTGVYKRRTQWWLLVIALMVVAVTGADSFRLYKAFDANKPLRDAVVAQAAQYSTVVAATSATATPTPTPTATLPIVPGAIGTPERLWSVTSLSAELSNSRSGSGDDGGPPARHAGDSADTSPTPLPDPYLDNITAVGAAVVTVLDEQNRPFGYNDRPTKDGDRMDWVSWSLRKVAGLLATVFAVSLGAPFWFDVIKRVANIRAAGPRPS